jgi:membrane fusion protein, multidrug efflux system
MKIANTLLILILFTLAGCKPKISPVKNDEAVKVRTTKIKTGEVSVPIHSTGVLTSDQEMKLSFKTGGIIARIPVSEGDKVKKGALLASLNLSEINAQVNQAMNGFEKAQRDFKRAANLYRDSVATLEQYQNANTALSVARSNLEIAQYNLSHSTIIAPDNGVVLKLLYKTNEMVGSGYPVFLFGSTGKNWKIKAGFPDKDIVKINQGDSARVILDAWPGVNFRGIVSQVAEMSAPLTGTYEAEISLKDDGYRFASGFVAGVDVYPSKAESFLTVPVQSLIEADGRSAYVFIVNSEGRAKKIKVDILTLIGTSAAVTGIADSIAEIVSEGAAYLRDGVKVEVVK